MSDPKPPADANRNPGHVTEQVHGHLEKSAPVPSHKPSGSGVSSNILVILALITLVVFLLHILGMPIPGLTKAPEPIDMIPQQVQARGVELFKNADKSFGGLKVSDEVADSLGIRQGGIERVTDAIKPKDKRPIVLSGSTALDPLTLWRIRIRFPSAEVIEMGKIRTPSTNGVSPDMELTRELRPGDRVKKGDLLMVLFSVDVGQKKNDMIDARVQLKLDQEILDRANSSSAVPEVFVLNAKRNVEADRNAMVKAENTLRVWGIPDEDIKAAYDEADRIGKEGWQTRNREIATNSPWARVKLFAPESGVIVERNATLHETIVDNTLNLVQIAQVDRLMVVANAFEEELNSVLKLPLNERKWAIRTINQSNQSIEPGDVQPGELQAQMGDIEDVGYLIDVTQRSAVLKGHIDNRDDKFRAGQYVTATVLVPPPENAVSIPIQSLVEDERGQSLVFVRKPGIADRVYMLTRVKVLQRFNRIAYVSTLTPADQKPVSPDDLAQGILPLKGLQPGDRILTAGVLELKKEQEDLMADN